MKTNLPAYQQIQEIFDARKAGVKFHNHGGKWCRDEFGRRFYYKHLLAANSVRKIMSDKRKNPAG